MIDLLSEISQLTEKRWFFFSLDNEVYVFSDGDYHENAVTMEESKGFSVYSEADDERGYYHSGLVLEYDFLKGLEIVEYVGEHGTWEQKKEILKYVL